MLNKFWSVAVLAAFFLPAAHSATIWNGPDITYTKSGTSTDTILPGKVVLRRSSSGPLFNTALGETSPRSGSPKGIEFAFGDLSNAESLSYQTLDSMRRNPHLSNTILNQPMVAHILDGDIYFSIKFTTWGMHGAGSVKYTRSTAAAVVPPTVTLTSPTEGATFTSPATVNLSANANGGSGTITEVSFFNGANLAGTVSTAPYNLTVNNLAAGAYSFTAVAKTANSAATSGVVHVNVTAPVPTVALTSPVEGATFTAPTTIDLSANAGGAPITSVSFFNGATLLGSVPNAPYNFTLTNVAAGSYSFTAVANTAETSATSGAVHVTVNPGTEPAGDVTLHPVALSNGQFSFGYPTDPGFSYIIQKASAIGGTGFDWTSVSTNTPSGNAPGTAAFSEAISTDHLRFFRVGRVAQ